MSLFPAFLATRFPLKYFSWLAHFGPIGYPFYFSNAMKNACVIFFPPPPLLRPSSPSSQFSRRIIASSIIYEISYQIPNISRKKYIYIHSSNETIRKERKEKRKEIFLKIWSKWTNFSYISRKIKISIDSNWRGEGKKEEIGRYRKYKIFLESINIHRKEGEFFNANSE